MGYLSATLLPEYTRLFAFAKGELLGSARLFRSGSPYKRYSFTPLNALVSPVATFYRIFLARDKFTLMRNILWAER